MNNTLANGLHLLAMLSATAEPYSVTDVASRLAVPKSHAHRLLQTLVACGYVVQDDDRRYRIGLEPLAISKALLANHPLRTAAMPALHRLAAATRLDAIATVPHRQGSALVLAAVHPDGEQRDPVASVGNRLAYPGTATGALFAVLIPGFAPADVMPADRRTRIAGERLAVRDPDFGEATNGIAVAVRRADGSVMGGLGVSGPGQLMAAHASRICAHLHEAAELVERQLASQTPPQRSLPS